MFVRRRLLTLLVFFLGLLTSAAASADLRVVATTTDLAALAKQVGGERVTVTALAVYTQDPHWVDARPHLALELAKADMLLAVGLEQEVGWLPTLQTGSRNPKIQIGGEGFVDCSQFVQALEVPTTKVDRSMGDVHPFGNPHYMYDPRRAARVAKGIAARMKKLDPKNAEVYEKNAQGLVATLEKWRKHWEKKLAPLSGKQVIAYHKSFPYLADWLGFRIATHIEPRPGIPPNPAHVARVISTARQSDVKIILQESWHPDTTSKLIADKAGAKLVVVPGAPNFRGGQSYIGFVNEIVTRLEKALPK
jgi:zinc/manganese transport system substrate-binding protein